MSTTTFTGSVPRTARCASNPGVESLVVGPGDRPASRLRGRDPPAHQVLRSRILIVLHPGWTVDLGLEAHHPCGLLQRLAVLDVFVVGQWRHRGPSSWLGLGRGLLQIALQLTQQTLQPGSFLLGRISRRRLALDLGRGPGPGQILSGTRAGGCASPRTPEQTEEQPDRRQDQQSSEIHGQAPGVDVESPCPAIASRMVVSA
jgi:hypothetical protein